MVNEYIERSLVRKNRGVYFKKGKWLLHLLCFIGIWLISTARLSGKNLSHATAGTFLTGLLVILPFFIFFYCYCLYLIPYCFKRSRYRQFWTILVILLLIFPLIDAGLKETLIAKYPALKSETVVHQFWPVIFHAYRDFILNFIGFTSVLYLMELMEGIRTNRETYQNNMDLALTERNLLRTRIEPDFLLQSLDGIIHLAEEKKPEAPDTVIGFSDILRYRLYRSQVPFVLLSEELQYLEKLFLIHNNMAGTNNLTLEVEGLVTQQQIPPLALISIAGTLLHTYSASDDWSLLLYLLAEEKELQIAAELQTQYARHDTVLAEMRQSLELIFETTIIFAIEQSLHTYSIRICLPLRFSA